MLWFERLEGQNNQFLLSINRWMGYYRRTGKVTGDRKFVGRSGGKTGKAVYELRIHSRPAGRVYYTFHEDVLVMLCGGDKGTQQNDIERAKRLASEL